MTTREGDAILQATSSAIVDNTASGAANAGGGIYVNGDGNTNRVDFVGVTVAGNVSDTGAGFALDSMNGQAGGGTLANSTVAGNRTSAGVEQDCAEPGASPQGLPIGSAGGNVVGDTTCAFVTTSDRQGANAQGYWMTASDGGIFNYNAGFFGSKAARPSTSRSSAWPTPPATRATGRWPRTAASSASVTPASSAPKVASR